MKKFIFNLFLIINVLFVNNAVAFDVAVEFSADAIQKAPSRPEYFARMFVSKDAVRTESRMNSIPVVEIVNTKKKTRSLLIPGDKVFLQQKSQNKTTNSKTSGSTSPCMNLADTSCKKLAEETINGRQTEKWEFNSNRNGQILRSLHWIDKERQMPIREFFPDGTVTELKLLGKETVNARQTEKWSMQMTGADGHKVMSMQWYDPELKMAIREEMPGGYIRELRNIKIGKQDKKIFKVPADYKKVTQLPSYMTPAPAQGQ